MKARLDSRICIFEGGGGRERISEIPESPWPSLIFLFHFLMIEWTPIRPLILDERTLR